MAMTSAEKVAAMRERARLAGLCIVCAKNPSRVGSVICEPCNESAKERVKRSRA